MIHTGKAAEAVSGRASGVLFFASFGAIWMGNGLAAMHHLNCISLAAIAAVLAALVVPAIRLLAAAKSASASEIDPVEQSESKRAFWRVNAIQWTAILAAVVFFNLIHQGDFLVAVITFIVGMHLFPLARLSRYPAHTVTGLLLVVWAFILAAAFPGAMFPSVGAIGTATILLGSSAWAIWSASRVAKVLTSVARLQTS